MKMTRPLRDRSDLHRRCERLLARSALLDTSGLDFDRAGDHELAPAVLETLVYMRDVEGFTSRYLDGFAGHPATLGDPQVARFLEIWQAEEGAHAEAIDRFLRSYCDARGVPFPSAQEPPPVRTSRVERLAVQASRPVGHVVTATHMAWGATNELLTLTGYRLLASRCDHPMLSDLLSRIAAQESRHYGFYHLQTEWRLGHSRLARKVVPALMARTWTPVGIGEGFKTPSDFDRVLTFLASDAASDARIDSMDEVVRRLPGCSDLRLYRDAVEESRRRLPSPGSGGGMWSSVSSGGQPVVEAAMENAA